MSNAKDLESTWSFMSDYAKKNQAKHLLENGKKHIIHEVNKLKIFMFSNHFEVINEETYFVKFFDTEEEAVNYCLDVYKETKINAQLEFFKNK
jgi:hypothetical protein